MYQIKIHKKRLKKIIIYEQRIGLPELYPSDSSDPMHGIGKYLILSTSKQKDQELYL